ncbi:diguanylate cyclase [Pontibacillus yanchengensis]|uniref:Diguanylate cyclase n=1 Tax=Pontibacillus yanchengensis TaxID=462910 RepID=A0A6I5A2U9_9BACI|nr:diguanylate cyclase [Pontibacillus yanchengensis]
MEESSIKAEQLRAIIESHSNPSELEIVMITVSIGIAAKKDPADTFAFLYKQADAALYNSKQAGRNSISLG